MQLQCTYLYMEVSMTRRPVAMDSIRMPSMATLKETLSGRLAPALAACMTLLTPAAVLAALFGSSTTLHPR